MKSYSKIDFTSNNKPKKRFVQSFFYVNSKIRGNVLILCGPDLLSHVQDARYIMSSFNHKLSIYEKDIFTYNKNIKDLKKIKSCFKINIENKNIVEAFDTRYKYRFIDLDFCNSLDSNIKTIENAFNYLKNLKGKSKNLNKQILITFTLRGTKFKKSINTLCNLFNIKNNFFKNPLLHNLNYYDTLNYYNDLTNRNEKASYILYRDGMPMCTFSYEF